MDRQEPTPKKRPKRSDLENRWAREWERQGGPVLIEEFEFHHSREWRADFANMESRTLIEIEGGANGGRHTRVKGFLADAEKYLTAHLHGWEVIRISSQLVRSDIIRAVIGRMRQKCAEIGARSDEEPAGCVSVAEMGGDAPAWLSGGKADA